MILGQFILSLDEIVVDKWLPSLFRFGEFRFIVVL